MTQLTNEHFELHDHNKAKLYKSKKFGVALSGLNNQINRLDKLRHNANGYDKEQLDAIINDLTDVFVDLKIETGVDI